VGAQPSGHVAAACGARHDNPTPVTPPEGMSGGVGLQGEVAPDAWGCQGGVQGQDLMWDPGLLRVACARVELHVPTSGERPSP